MRSGRIARSAPRLAAISLLAVAAVVTSVGLRHVAHRREVVRLGYELSAATAQLRRDQEDHRRLRLEKSVLTQPDRIERLAANLGMTRPAPQQIRAVRSDPAASPAAPPAPEGEAR
jgi:cell division protein FtsL